VLLSRSHIFSEPYAQTNYFFLPPDVLLHPEPSTMTIASNHRLQPGVYQIFNDASGTVIDLAGNDFIIGIRQIPWARIIYGFCLGFPVHDGQNQRVRLAFYFISRLYNEKFHTNIFAQWEFAPLGEGYSIRSLYNGHYLTIEEGIHDGVRIIASRYPTSWALEVNDFEKGTWW